MSLKKKLMVGFISLICFFSLLIFLMVNIQVIKRENYNYRHLIDISSQMGMKYINEAYFGNYNLVNGKLYKGENPLEGNNSLVEKICEETGTESSIIRLDTRVATTIKDSKSRPITGGKESDKISKKVFQGKEYTGQCEINGKKYISKYIPIKDSNNKVIGMWFVGVDKNVIKKTVIRIDLIIFVAAMAVVLIASLLINFYIKKIVLNNLSKLSNSLHEISAGDLTTTCSVNTKDEIRNIAHDINIMERQMKKLISGIIHMTGSIKNASQNIANTSDELATSSNFVYDSVEDMSRGASIQANEIEKCIDYIDSLANNISNIQHKTEITLNDTNNVKNKNESGLISLNNLRNKMDDNTTYMDNVANNMGKIVASSKNIEIILAVINEISKRTHLLSLNASIEAARAGDKGKGFEIVANEIRKLAEISQTSTKKIENIINEMQEAIDLAKISIDKGKQVVQSANNSLELTEDSFKEITLSVNKVLNEITSLYCDSDEMMKSKDKVISSINNIGDISTKSVLNTKEVYLLIQKQNEFIQGIVSSIQIQNEMVQSLSESTSAFKI